MRMMGIYLKAARFLVRFPGYIILYPCFLKSTLLAYLKARFFSPRLGHRALARSRGELSFSSSPRPQCFRLGQSLNDARRVSAAVHSVSLAEPDSPLPAAVFTPLLARCPCVSSFLSTPGHRTSFICGGRPRSLRLASGRGESGSSPRPTRRRCRNSPLTLLPAPAEGGPASGGAPLFSPT